MDISAQQPLFRYWAEGLGPGCTARFADGQVDGHPRRHPPAGPRGRGLAVLPVYRIRGDLDAGRLVGVLPGIVPQADHFRLLFRHDDPRRATFATLAEHLGCPLR